MIKEIEHINNAIADAVKSHLKAADIRCYGLAESVAIRGEEEVTFPAIVLPEGECISVYNETDLHDVTLYHRLANISFQEDTRSSFGSGNGYTEIDDLAVIVFGKRARISPFDAEQIARQAIATTKNCSIVSSDFNSLQVFATEYLGVTYFMSPDYFLFKINYRITSTYNARCANIE